MIRSGISREYISVRSRDRSLAITGERYEREGEKRTRRGGGGIKAGGSADRAREVQTAAPRISAPMNAAALARALRDLLVVIHDNEVMPVVVIDVGFFETFDHQDSPSIRKCLTVAHAAVVLALDQRAEQVAPPHVSSAQADLW